MESPLTNEALEVITRMKRAQSYVQDWHTHIDRWREMYNMNHYGKKGKPYEVRYNDPTYTNTVDLTVGIMLGNDLAWHAYGVEVSQEEQEETGKLEKLIQGTIEINDEREEAHQIYRLFTNFSRDGGGVIYSVFDPLLAAAHKTAVMKQDEAGNQISTTKYSEIPIRMRVVDPKRIFCLPGGNKRWLMIGRREQRSVLDVETQYGVKLSKFAHLREEERSSSMSEFADIWDYTVVATPLMDENQQPMMDDVKQVPLTSNRLAVRNTILFDGLPIVGPRIMDGYDDLPYTIQFFKPTGEDSDTWHSSLTPLESSVTMLERAFNRRARQIDVFTSLPLIIKSQPGRTVKVDPGLYNSIQISPDEGIEFPTWQGSAPDVQMQMDFLRSRIQQSGFSDVMFGSGNNQVAGYALSQLGDQNRIRLEQPIKHLELLLTTWAKKTVKLLTMFAEGSAICVYGTQKGKDYIEDIEVDDLAGYYIRAEIRPNFPNEQMRKVAMSTQVKGTLSNYTIMEKFLGVERPEDEEQRKIIEATTNHPLAIQYAIMIELEKRAKNNDKVAAMMLEQMQQGTLPTGEPGRPKEPNKPEQLTGTQSPTGQPSPSAASGQPAGQSALAQQQAVAESPQLME